MIDNGILAIISLIMISLGFINGFAFNKIITLDSTKKINEQLEESKHLKLETEEELYELEEDYDLLLKKYNEIFNKLNEIRLDRLPSLKIPSSPLERSDIYVDYTSDDDYTSNSISPDVSYKMD